MSNGERRVACSRISTNCGDGRGAAGSPAGVSRSGARRRACAEWAGSELGGPRLSIVPLIGLGPGTVLLDDLDQLHVVVVPISSAGVPLGAVVDTTVPVDAAGGATLTVPVVVIGRAQPFQVTLQGIRSSDGAVLYTGVATVVVSGAGANPPVSVPVSYIGPCRLGSGCIVTVAPQDSPLATGGSLV